MISAFLAAWLLLYAIAARDVGECLAKLSNTDALIRKRAATELESHRRRYEDELLRQVKDVLAKPDDEYNGRTHTLLQAVAALRAEKAVPDLVRSVDFTIDPETLPLGGFNAGEMYYPAAQALRSIGSRTVVNEILLAAKKPRSDDVLRIYAWILNEVLAPGEFVRPEKRLRRGDGAAHVVVEQARADATHADRERLSRLLKMVDEEMPLQRPSRKPRRNRPA